MRVYSDLERYKIIAKAKSWEHPKPMQIYFAVNPQSFWVGYFSNKTHGNQWIFTTMKNSNTKLPGDPSNLEVQT